MFGAGEAVTTVFSLIGGFYVWQSGMSGGNVLFWVMVVWNVMATMVTAVTPHGDYYAKA